MDAAERARRERARRERVRRERVRRERVRRERVRRERVRLPGVEMIEGGRPGGCEAIRVSRMSANRWRRALAAGGRAALASRTRAVRSASSPSASWFSWEAVLDAGPGADGYADRCWTLAPIAVQV